jgi:branched-chain amino acid transport system ATP-binding protein
VSSPLLELKEVTARYGPVTALHGISLRVDEGESVAVLGANGAGKTTTLRAVSGTVRRSGRIALGGKSIARSSPEAVARAGVAHVPEGRGTLTELSVRENLRLGAYSRRDRKGGACSRTFRGSPSAAPSGPAPSAAASSRCWRLPAR